MVETGVRIRKGVAGRRGDEAKPASRDKYERKERNGVAGGHQG